MSSRIYQNFIDERMFRYLFLVSSSCKSHIETRVEGVVNYGDSVAFSLMPKSSGARVDDVNLLSTLIAHFLFFSRSFVFTLLMPPTHRRQMSLLCKRLCLEISVWSDCEDRCSFTNQGLR
mgnify:CR=1 FL=1